MKKHPVNVLIAERRIKFMTCDGNCAAAHEKKVLWTFDSEAVNQNMFSEVAAIYPITPSSPMAEYIDE